MGCFTFLAMNHACSEHRKYIFVSLFKCITSASNILACSLNIILKRIFFSTNQKLKSVLHLRYFITTFLKMFKIYLITCRNICKASIDGIIPNVKQNIYTTPTVVVLK